MWLDGVNSDSDCWSNALVQQYKPCKFWKFSYWWCFAVYFEHWEHCAVDQLQRGAIFNFVGYEPAKPDHWIVQQFGILNLHYDNSCILFRASLSIRVRWILRHSLDCIAAYKINDLWCLSSSSKRDPWFVDHSVIDVYLRKTIRTCKVHVEPSLNESDLANNHCYFDKPDLMW